MCFETFLAYETNLGIAALVHLRVWVKLELLLRFQSSIIPIDLLPSISESIRLQRCYDNHQVSKCNFLFQDCSILRGTEEEEEDEEDIEVEDILNDEEIDNILEADDER